MPRPRVLTGIKPTGVPHLGNYLGAIQPAIELAKSHDSFLFIADLHALTTFQKREQLIEDTYSVAAAWIAHGLDPQQVVFYRQSDVPEIPMLAWILGCVLPKGLLERAHSYKDAMKNRGLDDESVNMGLFSYPVLMAADILAFDVDVVPVGKDQKQHVEICQEAARKLNLAYGETLKVPEARIDEKVMTIPGLDGRKMSKSYDNTIKVLGVSDKDLQKKMVNKIICDSTELGQPLRTESSTVAQLYGLFASKEQNERFLARAHAGRIDPSDPTSEHFGWGTAKKELFELLVEHFRPARAEYERLISDRGYLDHMLLRGAERARQVAGNVLERVLVATGVRASPR
jgi:tryptophanyl-tRNA synthetase